MKYFSILFIVFNITNLFWTTATTAQTTVNADFSSNIPTPACVPLSVAFNNSSTNASNYSWTLDGVFFSDEENPQRIFTQAGTYTICVTASDDNGAEDNHCEDITIFDGPMLSISPSVSTGCTPLEVTFTPASLDTDITNIVWDFGDGTITSTTGLESITHTYENASQYDINITAYNASGCSTSITEQDMITSLSETTPQFSADIQNSCQEPLTVQFTNTTNNTATNVTYSWDFGDGNGSTSENPTYTYSVAGDYDVSLTITNNDTGCSSITTETSFIQIGASPAFSYQIQEGGNCSEVSVAFTDESPSEVVIYAWDFGDGNTSDLANPNHTYTTIGCHTPSLTITTTDGCTSTYTLDDCIAVLDNDLSYTTSQPDSSCQAPFTVTFSTDYNGDLLWDFGGAGTSTDPNPSFTFTEPGSYPVTLTATLPNGCELSVTSTTVDITLPPVSFEADVLEGCIPLEVQFTDMSNLSDAVAWEWDFGDGNTSTAPNPVHTYTTDGEYDVSLTVTLANGCIGFDTQFNYIQTGYVPPVSFSGSPTETCIENAISFTETSEDTNIDYWYWDFGDGGFSAAQNPFYEYADTGYFDVQLIVGYNSCYDTLVQEDYMYLLPPKALFSLTQDCSNPHLVTIGETSIGADSWSWDFGDGNTSTQANPGTHTFVEHGEYIVSLDVFNQETGCTDNMTQVVYVPDPIPSFSLPEDTLCLSNNNQASMPVTNLSQDAVSYSWDGAGVQVVSPTDAAPSFQFDAPGLYTGMQLTITDILDCQHTFVYTDTVVVTGADAQFTYTNIDPNCNQTYQFTDASIGYHTDIVAWEWDFGDGFTADVPNPTHTYGQSGDFQVSLTVTTTEGCTYTSALSNTISIQGPYVTFETENIICLGEANIFENGSIAANFVDYSWDFGNGDTSTEWNPNYTYTAAGTYWACFNATTADGCLGQYCETITVEDISLGFAADVTTADCSPLVVQFTDFSTNTIAWEWDFGNGSGTSSLQNPGYTYTEAGSYDVCLTVTSAGGCSTTICQEDYIQIGGPTATVTASPIDFGCTPFEVDFIVDGNSINNYIMDFGDGNTASGTTDTDSFVVSHTYNAIGEFTPVIIVDDGFGCQATVTIDPIITSNLDVDIVLSDTSNCEGETIDFSADVSTVFPVTDLLWVVETADSTYTSTDTDFSLTYDAIGSYDVYLEVANGSCTEVLDWDDYFSVHPRPEVAFTADPAIHCGPDSVTFDNQSQIVSGTITDWAWDLGDGSNSALFEPIHEYVNPATYTATLTATSDMGCTQSNTFDITILEDAQATIIQDDPIVLCIGETYPITSEIVGTPSWSPAAGLSCTDCPNPIANPSSSTMYYLTVTNSGQCIATDSIFIERADVPPPVVEISGSDTICRGEMTQIIATGGANPFEYEWDDSVPGLSCYDNCSNPLVDIEQTSTFTVSVTNSVGCVTVDSFTVYVVGGDLEILAPDATICEGDSLALTVMGGENPVWDSNNTLSCTHCPDPIARPTTTTTYGVTVAYQGCFITDEMQVGVVSPEQVNAGEDITICPGQEVILSGEAPGTTTWAAGSTVLAENSNELPISPTSSTEYVFTATNDLCILSDTVVVNIREQLEVDAPDIVICEPGSVQLQASGEGITQYQWSGEGLSATNVANPIAIVDGTQTFTVTVSDDGFCTPATATVRVEVLGGPSISMPEQVLYYPGEAISIVPQIEGEAPFTYNWSAGCPDCSSLDIFPEGEQTYTLTVTDALGCTTTAEVLATPRLNCEGGVIEVPTGFSPNNDGNNDVFRPLGNGDIQVFRVFNRWGELIFESNNTHEGWDGTYQGEPLGMGVYVWYLEVICPIDGNTIIQKGDVTLVR